MAKLFPFKLQSQRIGSALINSNPFKTREQMIEQARKLRKEGAENIQPFMWSDVSGWIDDDAAVQALNTEPVAEQQLTFAQAADLLSDFSKLKRKLDSDEKEALAEILASVYHITELDLYPTGDTLDLMQKEEEERLSRVFKWGVTSFEPIIGGLAPSEVVIKHLSTAPYTQIAEEMERMSPYGDD